MRQKVAHTLRWLQWLLMLDYKLPRLLGWIAYKVDPSEPNMPQAKVVQSRW